MTPYPKYKPSSIEWIGDIPEHWNVIKLKYLLQPTKGALKPGPFGSDLKTSDLIKDGEIKVYTQRNVIDNDFASGEDYIDQAKFAQLAAFEIKPEDILVSTRGTIGKSAIFPKGQQRGILHPCLIRVQVNKKMVLNKWVQLYFNESTQFKENVKLNSNSTIIDVIYGNTLIDIPIPIPPFEIQNKLIEYLDHKTTQIDTLITNKQKLIDLLKEEKTAIINQAVTKGLDPNVKMQPSGIDWLGDIPEHWEVKKLKYIAKLKSGESITSEMIKADELYPVYGGNGLRGYYKDFTHHGDYILIGRQGALCGNINYGRGKFWASEHAVVVTIADKSNFMWLGELLRSMNLNQYSVAAAQPGLSVDNIQNLHVPVPPTYEQVMISKFIEDKTMIIDNTVSHIEKEIELMQEYRTTLISEVVTGKVDVRDSN